MANTGEVQTTELTARGREALEAAPPGSWPMRKHVYGVLRRLSIRGPLLQCYDGLQRRSAERRRRPAAAPLLRKAGHISDLE